jgi:hypothetical protein
MDGIVRRPSVKVRETVYPGRVAEGGHYLASLR